MGGRTSREGRFGRGGIGLALMKMRAAIWVGGRKGVAGQLEPETELYECLVVM